MPGPRPSLTPSSQAPAPRCRASLRLAARTAMASDLDDDDAASNATRAVLNTAMAGDGE